jgi:hypothetical protein
MWAELIGITGTLFVLLSFLMKDLTKVRIINIVGAILFVVYGLVIGALSTWLLNGILVIIHIIYLYKNKKQGGT